MSTLNPKSEKQDIDFRFYGIITYILFPVFLFGVLTSTRLLSIFLFPVIGVLVERDNKVARFSKKIVLYMVIILFGMKLKKKNIEHFRFWWFFTLGHIIGVLITLTLIMTLPTIVPVILILFNRNKFLRFMVNVLFLPKSEYIWTQSAKEREIVMKRYESLSPIDKEYLLFNKPHNTTHFFAILVIFASPILIFFLLTPINILVNILIHSTNLTANNPKLDDAILFILIGWGGIIPYILLNLPIRGQKISKLVNTKLATNLTKSLATTGLNAIPQFAGEYYLELESEVVDMSSTMGIVEIFRRGRLFSVIITPLAIMSLILRRAINTINPNDLRDIRINNLMILFHDLLPDRKIVIIGLIIIISVAISIILPLIWSLNDAEIKRTKWRHHDSFSHTEISSVEDLGTSVDGIFKLVIGISAITNISSSMSRLTGQNDPLVAYLLTGVILVCCAIMVMPGTFAMAYIYFASGDHVYGVNYMRYNLSRENDIAVGTVSRNYSKEMKLSVPHGLNIKFDDLEGKSTELTMSSSKDIYTSPPQPNKSNVAGENEETI